ETQEWHIIPHVIAEVPCEQCQSRIFEATWSGSASRDDRYVLDYGHCTDTNTYIGQASSIRHPGSAASRDFALPTRRSCRPIPPGHTTPVALMIGKKGANLVRGDE